MGNVKNSDIFYRLLGIKTSNLLASYSGISENGELGNKSKYSARSFERLKQEGEKFNPENRVFNYLVDETFSFFSTYGNNNDLNSKILQYIKISLEVFPASNLILNDQRYDVENLNVLSALEELHTMDPYFEVITEKNLLQHILIDNESKQYVLDILFCILIQTAIESHLVRDVQSKDNYSLIDLYCAYLKDNQYITPMHFFLNTIQQLIKPGKLYDFVPACPNRNIQEIDMDSKIDFLHNLRSEKEFSLGCQQTQQFSAFVDNFVSKNILRHPILDYSQMIILIYLFSFSSYIYTRFILDQKQKGNTAYRKIINDFATCSTFFKTIE